jgi:hypothetical protein
LLHNFFWLLLVGACWYLVFDVGGEFVHNLFWLSSQVENLKKEIKCT